MKKLILIAALLGLASLAQASYNVEVTAIARTQTSISLHIFNPPTGQYVIGYDVFIYDANGNYLNTYRVISSSSCNVGTIAPNSSVNVEVKEKNSGCDFMTPNPDFVMTCGTGYKLWVNNINTGSNVVTAITSDCQ